ncbi:MAG: inositol monophosphatase [Bacteroidales bacterium]|nr:inositol monophosphatase [Bacteroidales bacterium]
MMRNLEDICLQVVEMSQQVGEYLMEEKGNLSSGDVESKGKHDYVTYVDKTAEKYIVEGLSKIFPPAGFITEEGTESRLGDKFNWIVDPLDGTTNFIHGLAPFCISIALKKDDEIVLGVIYDPNAEEVFYAWEESPAFLNYQPISVSKTSDLDNALLATGFPYTDYDQLDEYMEVFKWCMQNTRGVRRLGSAAMDLAYVACGRMDGFFEYGLSPWDVAAGSFIVKQAGGSISDFEGKDDYIFGKQILAFNGKLHKDFQKVISGFFK